MPAMLLDEVLQESLKSEPAKKGQWVIDLFCGFRSMAGPAKERGLNCVGVDIKDFSAKTAVKITQKGESGGRKDRGAECNCTAQCPPWCGDTTAAASHGWACSKLYAQHRYDEQGHDRYAGR